MSLSGEGLLEQSVGYHQVAWGAEWVDQHMVVATTVLRAMPTEGTALLVYLYLYNLGWASLIAYPRLTPAGLLSLDKVHLVIKLCLSSLS